MDASWLLGGYDKEDFARMLGTAFCVGNKNSFFLAGYTIALRLSFGGPIPAAMQQMIDYLFAWAGFYAQLVTRWNLMDAYLINIPRVEYLYSREF